MAEFRVGVIGLGCRGSANLKDVLLEREDVVVTALCDLYEDRTFAAADEVFEKCGTRPFITSDYRELCSRGDVDVVCVFSSWENHIPAVICAMDEGKQVCTEVGGASELEDCFELIRAHERTGIHCMMLENCCYGRNELMALRMAREGFFGRVVHCEGGYLHDLRDEIVYGTENRHYRLEHYKNRCCENYPTHELGPIARVLNINRGNRMVRLSSVASRAFGLNDFAAKNENTDPALRSFPFSQGDIVRTEISCENGELISLTLDTTLPRGYSRNFTVRGTRALFSETCDGIFEEGVHDHFSRDFYGNVKDYRERWEHPIWEKFLRDGVHGGHDGMDTLVFDAYFTALSKGEKPPIDTYDTATWMAVTPLSAMSIEKGGSVEFPDLTDGRWKNADDTELF